MKKMIIMFVLVMVLMSSFCAVGLATDKAEENDVASKIEEAKDNSSVLTTQTAVYDFEKTASKSFSPSRLDGKATNSRASNWFANLLGSRGDNTATSKSLDVDGSGSRWPIDKIAARVRAYVDDALVKSGTDTQYNASYAGKNIDYDAPIWYSCEAYGNHTFEESGYVNWYPETYKDQ